MFVYILWERGNFASHFIGKLFIEFFCKKIKLIIDLTDKNKKISLFEIIDKKYYLCKIIDSTSKFIKNEKSINI